MCNGVLYNKIEIDNFRAFRNIKIENLGAINIIGGLNGAGKSALLETIFFSLDTSNPLSILKPFFWRDIEATSLEDLTPLLQQGVNSGRISTTGRLGSVVTHVTKGPIPDNVIASLTASPARELQQFRTSRKMSRDGYIVTVSCDNKDVMQSYLIEATDGFVGNIGHLSNIEFPSSAIIGSRIASETHEQARRLSNLIRNNREGSVVEPMRTIHSKLDGFIILQGKSSQQIFARTSDSILPINILGEGFRGLFEIILAITEAKGGCVLLDEMDSTLHYSKVADAWKAISLAAARENCQVFATSHSREAIVSASQGIRMAGRDSEFQYIRIEREDFGHGVVNYSYEELMSAEEFNLEFR